MAKRCFYSSLTTTTTTKKMQTIIIIIIIWVPDLLWKLKNCLNFLGSWSSLHYIIFIFIIIINYDRWKFFLTSKKALFIHNWMKKIFFFFPFFLLVTDEKRWTKKNDNTSTSGWQCECMILENRTADIFGINFQA